MTIYVATSNPGKLRDFALAAGPEITIEPLPGLAVIPAPPEDAPTFDGNARAKAIYYSHHAPGQLVMADDSGLEVDALNGDPGVRSARFADDAGYTGLPDTTVDERNNALLLQQLEGVPRERRQGMYRCVLAIARDGEVILAGNGELAGEILTAPQGSAGFGYDPLFFLPQYQKTMAELDADARLGCSHRGAAWGALVAVLTRHPDL